MLPGDPIPTANPDHQPIVPKAGGVPPSCTCGFVGGTRAEGRLLADHLRENDPTYGQVRES